MAKPRSRQGGATDNQDQDSEEARVFRAAVSDVTPLPAPAHPPHGDTLPVPRRRTRRQAPIVEAESPGAAALGDVVVAADDTPGVATPGAADPLSFRRPGVRDQTLRQLRRGDTPWRMSWICTA